MNITITFIGIYYLLLSEYLRPGLEQEDPHSPPRPLWAYKLPGFLLITIMPSKLDMFHIGHLPTYTDIKAMEITRQKTNFTSERINSIVPFWQYKSHAQLCGYADDTFATVNDEDLSILKQKCEESVNGLLTFMAVYGLSANDDKTHTNLPT